MISVPEVICILSSGFMLCLGLSPSAAHSEAVTAGELLVEYLLRGPVGENQVQNNGAIYMERKKPKGDDTIKGEVLRLEGSIEETKVQDVQDQRRVLSIRQTK